MAAREDGVDAGGVHPERRPDSLVLRPEDTAVQRSCWTARMPSVRVSSFAGWC
jgi:hypothetical protein